MTKISRISKIWVTIGVLHLLHPFLNKIVFFGMKMYLECGDCRDISMGFRYISNIEDLKNDLKKGRCKKMKEKGR